MKGKVLFITNRDVLTTCGALRLIKNRAEVLYREYDVSTDFCVFQQKRRINSLRREIISAGGNMWIEGYTLTNLLFAYRRFVKLIYSRLSMGDYKAVIISGAMFPLNVNRIKRISKIPIYIDGHGASEDIYECVRGHNKLLFFLRYMAYKLDVSILRYYLKRIDGCFVVSSGMRKYYENLTSSKSIEFIEAPCATITLSEHDAYIANRELYRSKFNVDKEICFVYSGGIEPWQSVQETIDIFKQVADRLSRPAKFFIFTYETEMVKGMIDNDNRFCVTSFKADELNRALCAMDFAFLIRKNTVTNNVAFPNKFLEYIKSRLYVISTPYIYDIAAQIESSGVGFIYDFDQDYQLLADYIELNKDSKMSESVVDSIIINNSFKTRLKHFAKLIN